MTNETLPKKKKISVKKRIIISVVTLIICAVLFAPYRYDIYKDGGTQEWRALTYVIVKWQNHFYAQGNPTGTNVYFFPYSFYSIDDLRKMR